MYWRQLNSKRSLPGEYLVDEWGGRTGGGRGYHGWIQFALPESIATYQQALMELIDASLT